jgi:glycine/D-amino acid oxidase-like deaminating enzyme
MTRTANTMAVIGLGVMGAPMAAILIDAGYDVVGFNRSPLGATAALRMGALRAQGNGGLDERAAHAHRDAVGRRERQPCRRAGPAPRPQRNPGTPTCMKPSGTTLICRSSTHLPREMEERND